MCGVYCMFVICLRYDTCALCLCSRRMVYVVVCMYVGTHVRGSGNMTAVCVVGM